MKVFVAGASGAIGRPLIAELLRQGHAVTGMTRSETGARNLAELGAAVARVSAFHADAVQEALRQSQAELVIDQLTALPRHPSEMPSAAAEIYIARRGPAECGGICSRQVPSSSNRAMAWPTSPKVWPWTPAPAWPRVREPTPNWKRGC